MLRIPFPAFLSPEERGKRGTGQKSFLAVCAHTPRAGNPPAHALYTSAGPQRRSMRASHKKPAAQEPLRRVTSKQASLLRQHHHPQAHSSQPFATAIEHAFHTVVIPLSPASAHTHRAPREVTAVGAMTTASTDATQGRNILIALDYTDERYGTLGHANARLRAVRSHSRRNLSRNWKGKTPSA